MYYSHKVHRQGRSETTIDPDNYEHLKLPHGRVVWKRPEEVPYYLDAYEKRFMTEDEFKQNKKVRARLNRERHAAVPFGVMKRQARKLTEQIFPPCAIFVD